MKKFLALLLALAMVACLFVGCSDDTTADDTTSTTPSTDAVDTTPDTDTEDTTPVETTVDISVALVTDVGTIDDESFNQATWQGVKEFCEANGVEYNYYQPTEDSTDARVASISTAIAEGYNVVVMPGYLFGESVLTVQDTYPDVYFIAIDVGSGDLTFDYETYYEPSANTVCITFEEDQAGYLAGYAAVKDGYTKLGFLGGMAVPAVIRYGYGFVQGANAAAEELGNTADVSIKYTYGGQFYGDASITAKMDGWYADGTEVVFACGGGIYTSAVEAANNNGAKVIGVDVDQHYIDDCIITSAMKNLQESVVATLEDLYNGNWEAHSGLVENKSLAEGDYVGLPTAEESWGFENFTTDDYNTVLNELMDGTRVCSSDTDNAPEVSITVDYID
jgi:basic membrane protein A